MKQPGIDLGLWPFLDAAREHLTAERVGLLLHVLGDLGLVNAVGGKDVVSAVSQQQSQQSR